MVQTKVGKVMECLELTEVNYIISDRLKKIIAEGKHTEVKYSRSLLHHSK